MRLHEFLIIWHFSTLEGLHQHIDKSLFFEQSSSKTTKLMLHNTAITYPWLLIHFVNFGKYRYIDITDSVITCSAR